MAAARGGCVEKAHFVIIGAEEAGRIGETRMRSPEEMSGGRGSIVFFGW